MERNQNDFEAADRVADNIQQLARLFPQAVTETPGPDGQPRKTVDFPRLRALLGVGEEEETYGLTWAGKSEALRETALPTAKVLRPCLAESKHWDSTGNLYLEGDNLDVLKLLQRSHRGRVKMIFIDPPYNTGNRFIYRDSLDHSAWCGMMYPRLSLAKPLLREDGVLFASIDDRQVHNLRHICDELFGEEHFVANLVWQSRTSISNEEAISLNHNHILVYAAHRPALRFGGDPIDPAGYHNPDNDPRGPWKPVPIDANHLGGDTRYPIVNPATGAVHYPPNGRIWAYNRSTFQALLADGRIVFGKGGRSAPKRKLYYNERLAKGDVKTPSSLLLKAGTTRSGTREIMELLGDKMFDYPKPVSLLTTLLSYGCPDPEGVVLDFFSGSATTAHAVMRRNAEDGGKRSFIMVQLPEEAAPDSPAHRAGYRTICDIGKERIRRSGERIKEEFRDKEGIESLDVGFRVLKLTDDPAPPEPAAND